MTELLERADGGAIALGGGSVLSRARPRGAAPPRRRLARGRARRRRGSGSRDQRPLARDRERFEALLAERAAALRGARRRGRCRPATATLVARALPSLLALSRAARRNADGVGGERLRRLPGARRPRPARRGRARSIGRRGGITELAGRPFCVTDATVGALYAEALEPSAGRVEVAPGEASQDARRGRAGAARAGARRHGPRSTTSSRSAAASSATSPASAPPSTSAACRSSRCRRRSSPRSTPPTAARPASTCPRRRTTSAPTTCPRRCSPIPRPLATLPGAGARRRVRRGGQDRADRRRRALGAGAPRSSARRRRRSIQVIFDCVRTKLDVVAADERDSGGRAGAQPRPHRRPRDRGRRAATRATATARRSGSGCSRRCGSPAPAELRDEVGDAARAPRPADDARSPLSRPTTVLDGDRARQEADRRRGRLRPLERPGEPRSRGRSVEPDRVRAAVEELALGMSPTAHNRVEVLHGVNLDMLGRRPPSTTAS